MTVRLWPKSLKGQMLLAVALALLLAQTIHAVLLYRALSEQRGAALIHTAAMRLLRADRRDLAPLDIEWSGRGEGRRFWVERSTRSPLGHAEQRDLAAEERLREILAEQDVETTNVVAFYRPVARDPAARQRLRRDRELIRRVGPSPGRILIAALQRKSDGVWLIARVFVPPGERLLALTLAGQTLLIYVVLVGAIALILRRITRPLAALTGRLERFGQTRDARGQLAAEGPEDVRRLIFAHNSMENRISALLDEKDVMLGAIGHDLKTPLAALRVRIEAVEDDTERARLAATIEDMNRTLEDILSLARVGHDRAAREPVELTALAGSIVEEYEDMGEPVSLESAERIVMQLRPTWMRRALRNLIGNALRYGKVARVSLVRAADSVTIRIDDDGPGIPESEMARMLEPFARGEPSRNSTTGGAGLGLAIARTVAEQHDGTLTLSNRLSGDGAVIGLTAVLRLPIS